jgi:hypothetical protein
LARIFLIFFLHYSVLKKDSRQAGMTNYEGTHHGFIV